jgi:hypothetical protein
LGSGEPLGLDGLKPDIQVAVPPDDEKIYFADPYRLLAKSLPFLHDPDGTNAVSTNRLGRHRINEAELVRMQKEGLNLEDDTAPGPGRSAEPVRQTIQDPVLARGLDLLKGLALIQRNQGRN